MKQLDRGLYAVFSVLFSFFFGEVLTSQILGLAEVYRQPWVSILTLALAAGAFWALRQAWAEGPARGEGDRFWPAAFTQPAAFPAWADAALAAAGLALIALLIVTPVANWPYSPVSETLHWDAGAYHFPKAIELARSGSLDDLSIPYGEYPAGYESLLAFGFSLTHNEMLFGAVHALIALFACLAVYLLGRRFTRLPVGLVLFATAAVFLSELITVKGNPFYIFLDQSFMIGKNDLFLACGVLAALLFAPTGNRRYHLAGLTGATLWVLATKPSGMFVVAPLWVWVAWGWLREARQAGPRALPWRELLGCALVILPGGLWAVRNLIVLGGVFPPGVWVMADWSIANNLTNPFFYAYLPRNFQFLLGVFGLTAILTVWKKLPGWRFLAAFTLLFAAFAFTPESAFQKTVEEPTRIAWRLGVALVVFEFLAVLALLEPLFTRALRARRLSLALPAALAGAAVLFSGWLVFENQALLGRNPANEIVLRDEFRDSVGADGYHSPYDYVQKNIRDSVIQVEGGYFYYLYGPGFTNFPTKLHYPLGAAEKVPQLTPQYYVIVNRPEWQPNETFLSHWKLLYADSAGQVFERK